LPIRATGTDAAAPQLPKELQGPHRAVNSCETVTRRPRGGTHLPDAGPKSGIPLRLIESANSLLHRWFPEQRIFLRSDTQTRFLRLRPLPQALGAAGLVLFMGWSVIASSIVLIQGATGAEQADATRREQVYFETRLNELAAERDIAALEAQAAHARFTEAMERVAQMQGALLSSEQRRAELEQGLDALQVTLRSRSGERDSALQRLAAVEAATTSDELQRATQRLGEIEQTLDFVLAALGDTAQSREDMIARAEAANQQIQHLALEYRLIQDRNARIFNQLEQAVEVSMLPLEQMFRAAGLSPDQILQQVRAGYQSREAALRPISISTSGTLEPDSDEARANAVLTALAEIDTYRLAAERAPFAMPVRSGAVRHTSGFGMRRDPRTGASRMHSGVDWAGPQGTPIAATGDGTISFAGRRSGFGNLVIIRHDFGIETYYAHLHTIAVTQGQRVSRGDRIGGMGTTGRSTGVHLHYEIRVNGRPINPMTYIRAAQNVF